MLNTMERSVLVLQMHIFCKSCLIYIYETSWRFLLLNLLMRRFLATSIADLRLTVYSQVLNLGGKWEEVKKTKIRLCSQVFFFFFFSFFFWNESERKVWKRRGSRGFMCQNLHPIYGMKVRGIKGIHLLLCNCPLFTLTWASTKYMIEDIIVK